jgi:hypothetical protein
MRISLLLVLALLTTACLASQPETEPTAGVVDVDKVQSTGDRLTFSGTTTLPDGACLNTSLLADEALFPDWPVDCVRPTRGVWRLEVLLGEQGGPPRLNRAAQYRFHVWLQDQPAVQDVLPFDLAGPPTPVSH